MIGTESTNRVIGTETTDGPRSVEGTRSGPLGGLFHLLPGRRGSLERLRTEIEPVHTEIHIRQQNEGRPGAGGSAVHWLDGAEEQVRNARRAVEDGEPEVGWRNLLQARRLLVHSYDARTEAGRSELRARTAVVRTEAEEKLDGWRLDAVRELLSPPGTTDTGPIERSDDRPVAGGGAGDGPSDGPDAAWIPSPEAIYTAAEILDARHGNVHRRVALVRKQVLALVLVELVGVIGILALATYWQSPFLAAPGSAALLVAIALFGLMGASAGRLVTLVRASSPEKLPVLAINWWTTVGRTLMGAAAALALYAFVHSGVVAVAGVDAEHRAFQALVLAVAFAAGFSERLLERAVDALGGSGDDRSGTSKEAGTSKGEATPGREP